ncbi:MAG TPA: hypothetical protein DCQ36_04500, partial [Actinobacteria bacterium]|nr:hypothetical protein [Actinomycetota bacterium]
MPRTSTAVAPPRWSAQDLPDLTGRTVIVTGSTSGIGLVTARELAAHGAATTLAVRDTARGEQTRAMIERAHPGARVDVGALDLADLSSVRAFARDWAVRHPDGLDILINNA